MGWNIKQEYIVSNLLKKLERSCIWVLELPQIPDFTGNSSDIGISNWQKACIQENVITNLEGMLLLLLVGIRDHGQLDFLYPFP